MFREEEENIDFFLVFHPGVSCVGTCKGVGQGAQGFLGRCFYIANQRRDVLFFFFGWSNAFQDSVEDRHR